MKPALKLALIVVVVLVAFPRSLRAQELSFKDTIAAYNSQRIHTNKKGMLVLGSWGIANVAAGGLGYFTAKTGEWRYFHEMNALWGVVNAGIAGVGFAGARKELSAHLNYRQSYDRYLSNKKLYLVNACLDVVYIGTGVGLASYGSSAKSNAEICKGFGKSLVLQGVFLLLFDNVMFASHARNNARWFQIISEIRVSNAGVGVVHPF
jgi:hypothetical protein